MRLIIKPDVSKILLSSPMPNKILCLCVFCLASLQLLAQDLFDFDHSKRYGTHLFLTQDHESAINELKRCLFLTPDSLNEELVEMLLISYRKTGQSTKVIDFVNKNYTIDNRSDVIKSEVHHALILQQDFVKGQAYLDDYSFYDPFTQQKFTSVYAVLNRDIERAKAHILSYKPINSSENEFVSKWGLVIENYSNEKTKVPLTAGLLSTFVPGLGKVYTGRLKDAFFSFFMTSISAYQAYRGFSANGRESAIGWAYAGLATGFYLGGIYGSARSARVYNERVENKYYHEALSALDIHF